MALDSYQLILQSLSLLSFDYAEFHKQNKIDLLAQESLRLKQKGLYQILHFIFIRIGKEEEVTRLFQECFPVYNHEIIQRFKLIAHQHIKNLESKSGLLEGEILPGKSVLEAEDNKKTANLLVKLLELCIKQQIETICEGKQKVPVFNFRKERGAKRHPERVELCIKSLKSHILNEQNKLKLMWDKQERFVKHVQKQAEQITQTFQQKRQQEIDLTREEESTLGKLQLDLKFIQDPNFNLDRTRWSDLLKDCHTNIRAIDEIAKRHNLKIQIQMEVENQQVRYIEHTDIEGKFREFQTSVRRLDQSLTSPQLEEQHITVLRIKTDITANFLGISQFKETLHSLFNDSQI